MIIDKNAYDANGNVVTSVAQWDSDITIYISDPGITTNYAVDFFNPDGKMSYKMESSFSEGKLKVKIPNILLQTSYAIIGFVTVDSFGGNRTMYRVRINVVKRPFPSDYVYVDTEDYISAQEMLAEMHDALEAIFAAQESAITSINAVEIKANNVMAALESTSVQFNVTAADDNNGNVTVIATVVT